MTRLIDIKALSVAMLTARGDDITILERINLAMAKGETLGLVGESGSGKSTLAKAILRALPAPAYIAGGAIEFEGRDLLAMTIEEMRRLRWSQIAMVVQSALDSLNPVLSLEDQFIDTMMAKMHTNRKQARERAAACLVMTGLKTKHLKSYPHELSGGMRQRAVIAMAMLLEPKLLIMDEPTTALDVITQAEILATLKTLQQEQQFSVILITHDLPLALDFCDRIAVMYAGKIVEDARAQELFDAPFHPYTHGLIHSFPRIGELKSFVKSVPGQPVSFAQLPTGCAFHPRCEYATQPCTETMPRLSEVGERMVRCFQPQVSSK